MIFNSTEFIAKCIEEDYDNFCNNGYKFNVVTDTFKVSDTRLANAMGIDPSTLRRWKNKNNFSVSTLKKIESAVENLKKEVKRRSQDKNEAAYYLKKLDVCDEAWGKYCLLSKKEAASVLKDSKDDLLELRYMSEELFDYFFLGYKHLKSIKNIFNDNDICKIFVDKNILDKLTDHFDGFIRDSIGATTIFDTHSIYNMKFKSKDIEKFVEIIAQ